MEATIVMGHTEQVVPQWNLSPLFGPAQSVTLRLRLVGCGFNSQLGQTIYSVFRVGLARLDQPVIPGCSTNVGHRSGPPRTAQGLRQMQRTNLSIFQDFDSQWDSKSTTVN